MFRVPLGHDCLKLLSSVSPFVKSPDPRSIIHSRKLVCGWLAVFPYLSGSQYARGWVGVSFSKSRFSLYVRENSAASS